MGNNASNKSPVLAGETVPPGYNSVNAFVAVRGPGGAVGFIEFMQAVFAASETLSAHTLDADDLLIHAEVRIGDATIMLCDAKPHWAFTPALLQVYVADAANVTERARASGATVITEPVDFHGDQKLARFIDPWSNIWWLFQYDESSRAPSEMPNELPSWRPDPSAPPSYAHSTIDQAMSELRRPG